MANLYACTLPSALGEFVVAWDPSCFPRVKAIHLPTSRDEQKRLLSSCEPCLGKRPPLVDQLARYCAGEKVRFSWRDLDWRGVPDFHLRVYRVLFDLPRGRVTTYADLARLAGNPRAARAVGQAMARNPLPIVVPCHRVVRSDGHLGGFGGGLEMKHRLLSLEGVRLPDPLHVEKSAID